MSVKYYKYTNPDGTPCNGRTGQWSLPKDGKPGEWMPSVEVDPCNSGYHLCEAKDLLEWSGPSLWIAEGMGKFVRSENKTVFPEARLIKPLLWDDRIARHFACDCAERVLKIIEKENPNEKRPAECIRVSRLYADGKADDAAWAAARDAAWDAAYAAASYAAARDAERKWQIKRLLAYATGKIKLPKLEVRP